MTPGERWLTTLWPLVHARLPAPPAHVVEIGCGPLGGFVPMLRANGYDALGIDPQAPEEPHYQRIEFERAELPPQVDRVERSVLTRGRYFVPDLAGTTEADGQTAFVAGESQPARIDYVGVRR